MSIFKELMDSLMWIAKQLGKEKEVRKAYKEIMESNRRMECKSNYSETDDIRNV